jgi:AcrR family transcriptional regulator
LEDAVTQAAEVGTEPGAGHPASRRDRLRAATTEEIIQTARGLLVASGPDAVTLRAIAREMGMTAPGLYRYFDNRDELVRHICASIFTELGSDIGQAIQGAAAAAGLADTGLADTGLADTGLADTGLADTGRPDQVTTLTLKMVAACQEFRRWSLNHRAEFSLLFGVPLPGLDDGRYDVADECALAFAGTFFALFLELWTTVPACATSSSATATRWAPTSRSAPCSPSCAAGWCCTARWPWRCSATSGSRWRIRRPCSSSRSATWLPWSGCATRGRPSVGRS